MNMPKALKKVIGKVDVRAKPDPKLAKLFKEGCNRRYMNVGIATLTFYKQLAKDINNEELIGYAKEIEQAVYTKDGDRFELYQKLFKGQMQTLGVWTSIKGIDNYQKLQVINKLRKMAKGKRNEDK